VSRHAASPGGYTIVREHWSRGRSFAAADNQRQTTILRRLAASFEDLWGVPYESVTDTMAGVVDGWD